ncbi:MAG: hypothetical protein HY064_05125 [Bacteroidetes bacterium]|nr:hypothetical protein [Bacteroidota bacterium]
MKFRIFILSILFPLLLFSQTDKGGIDSVSFYSNARQHDSVGRGNLRYVHERYEVRESEYTYHENGRLHTVKSIVPNESYNFTEYSEDGKMLFDTVWTPDYYVHSAHYYPDGSKKSYYSKKMRQQSNDTPILTQYFSWDQNGELNHFTEVDTSGRTATDENYPLRKYKNLTFYRAFYSSGYLKEQGFLAPSMSDSPGEKNKYGAWFTFFSNGQLQTAGLFIANIPWGMHYEYEENGKLLSVKYYVKGVLVQSEPGISITTVNFTSGKDTIHSFTWNHFGYEGLYEMGQDYKNPYAHSYYFHAADLANVPDPSPVARLHEGKMIFGFPPGDVWCTWSLYSITIDEQKNISAVSEGISENSYGYYDNGQLRSWVKGTTNTRYDYNENGSISKIETTGHLRTWFIYNVYPVNFPVDTTRTYDRNGRISTMTIYGTRGQIFKTMNRNADSTWTSVVDSSYQHFYILIKGHWVEILDHDATFTGEWKFICENGNYVMEGHYDGGKNGEWKDYYRNGKLHTDQYYDDNKEHAEGIFKSYDENGTLIQKGYYDGDRKQNGVWKAYTNGKKISRVRYVHDREAGFYSCKKCCANKDGRPRNQLSLFINGKEILHLHNCHRKHWDYDY